MVTLLTAFKDLLMGPSKPSIPQRSKIEIFYGTSTQNSLDLSQRLSKYLEQSDYQSVEVTNLEETDFEYFLQNVSSDVLYVFFVSTDHNGSFPKKALPFWKSVQEAKFDFRVNQDALNNLQFVLFGNGNRDYGMKLFCKPAKELDLALREFGAQRALFIKLSEDDLPTNRLESVFFPMLAGELRRDVPRTAAPLASAAVEEPDIEEFEAVENPEEKKPMVTAKHRKQLEKEGYSVVGSHSGVKLCRWTKHHLAGCGACYKHTFYGISSKNCMEATPSLACANKCIFCWRHHKNPTGTTWRWEQDSPAWLVHQFIEKQKAMLKVKRCNPGVTEESLQESFQVKHCALSLVGEPIMYPLINEILELLHARHISTFLVTNAQFPGQLKSIQHCTQLYISIDASNKVDLKAIDQPLFEDYWERFIECIDVLAEKAFLRTVFRLTLVKDKNMEDHQVQGYAKLIQRGRPDFIEIKGVTFAGSQGKKMDDLDLKITNTPWHWEVKDYGERICAAVQALSSEISEYQPVEYQLACEHEHSLCILLARTEYKNAEGQWCTWIDYPKYFELVESGQPFTALDFALPTPSWAAYNSPEQGFDPDQTRKRKPGRITREEAEIRANQRKEKERQERQEEVAKD